MYYLSIFYNFIFTENYFFLNLKISYEFLIVINLLLEIIDCISILVY